jgi:hypothetical protein
LETMTHYMQLLVTNQPWNLIIFMAIVVICAETLAIAELVILFTKNNNGLARKISKITGIIAGFYFLGIFIYLFREAVIPLSAKGEWRGIADIIAVGFYLSGVIPLFGITLLELGAIGKRRDEKGRQKLHVTFVAIFLIVAHIAMIFGMLNPQLLMSAATGKPGM